MPIPDISFRDPNAVTRILRELDERVYNLEMRGRSRTTASAVVAMTPYVVFCSGDSATAPVANGSGKYRLRQSGSLGIWYAELVTAGSSSTSVVVKLSGSTVSTITLTSGQTETLADLSATNGNLGDIVTVTISGVGTSARGLTVLAPVV